jgi:nucleoside phosphorylase
MAPIARVAVLFAMDAEARPLIDALGLTLDADAFARVGGDVPMRVYSGTLKSGARVDVVCAGSCARHNVCNVGTVGAALSTYETCATLRPDVIVTAGTAGARSATSTWRRSLRITIDEYRSLDTINTASVSTMRGRRRG